MDNITEREAIKKAFPEYETLVTAFNSLLKSSYILASNIIGKDVDLVEVFYRSIHVYNNAMAIWEGKSPSSGQHQGVKYKYFPYAPSLTKSELEKRFVEVLKVCTEFALKEGLIEEKLKSYEEHKNYKAKVVIDERDSEDHFPDVKKKVSDD